VTGRLVIEDIRPRTPHPTHFAKAVTGERIRVTAVMFRDGHDPIAGRALLFADGSSEPVDVAVLEPLGNDEWEAFLVPDRIGRHRIEVQGWTVRFGMSGPVLDVGHAVDLTTSEPVRLWVDRERALSGAWYELFPRSFGGFKGVLSRVPELATMGFDVLYVPPIHPIGRTFRKGPNNTLEAGPGDPGSPWAIGSEEGGHTAIHPDLGTDEDLLALITELKANGMELALDYALQCAPDHPWVAEHPEWFHHRPDGTIACAENPPKIYQDIYPLNFWPDEEAERLAMWSACKAILDHWISYGVRIFRVDNPHTKPMAFWEWVIEQVQSEHPDVLFLAEAFTRPHIMARLAEAGFSQSYTYFTWRTEQHGPEGLWAYMEELAEGPKADYMRPNFWPTTPDILSGPLRNGPPSAFALRLVLAATLSPSYGVYSGYELYENEPAAETNEEFLNSEKYEIRHRDYDQPGTLAPLMSALNRIRRYHPAFSRLRTVRFWPTTNPQMVAYTKTDDAATDRVLTVVNLDPHNAQDCIIHLDVTDLGLPASGSYLVYDELSHETYTWTGADPYVRLDPRQRVAHIFSLNLSTE
jgi:starch synthase (maltosyl-transferring)